MVMGLKNTYLNVYNGIRNVKKWLPIIWKDRDWDYTYLMAMMDKKLKNMGELHENYGYGERSGEYAKDLKEASKLAKRLSEEDYEAEANKGKEYLYSGFKTKIVSTKEGYRYEIEFPKLTEEDREELKKAMDKENKLMENDKKRLFEIMDKELFNWWD